MLQILGCLPNLRLHFVLINAFLNIVSNFLGGLVQHFIQSLRHLMVLSQIAGCALSSLRVRVQGRMVVLQKLLLHGYVVVRYAQHDHPVTRVLGVPHLVSLVLVTLSSRLHSAEQFILNQQERLHGVLQGKLVLPHLTQNSADVNVDITRIRY